MTTTAPKPHTRLRVLAIENDEMVGRVLPRVLPQHAVTVERAPRAALARIAAGEVYDAILCDVMMPDMNGDGVFRAWVESRPDVAGRVIFMTAGILDDAVARAIESTGRPTVAKPFGQSQLEAAIDAVVRAHGRAA